MKSNLFLIALLATLFVVILLYIGIFNGSYVWPIIGVRISVMHIFALSIVAFSLAAFQKAQKNN